MILPQFTCSNCGVKNSELRSNLIISQSGKTETGFLVPFNLIKVERECSSCLKHHKSGVSK